MVRFVLLYLSNFKLIALLLVVTVSLISCCPKEGVDRSYQDNSYNLTIDIQNSITKQPIASLDYESRLVIVFSNGSKSNSQSFSTGTFPNRYTFYFDSNIKDEDVASVEVRLIDYKDQILDYKTIAKTLYQRDPVPMASNMWDGFFCKLNPISILLPQANALSCKSKDGSKTTWRSGYLISVGLIPED